MVACRHFTKIRILVILVRLPSLMHASWLLFFFNCFLFEDNLPRVMLYPLSWVQIMGGSGEYFLSAVVKSKVKMFWKRKKQNKQKQKNQQNNKSLFLKQSVKLFFLSWPVKLWFTNSVTMFYNFCSRLIFTGPATLSNVISNLKAKANPQKNKIQQRKLENFLPIHRAFSKCWSNI